MKPRKLRCSARSARTGKPCRKWAIAGGTVCPTHGGSAGHVKAAARERLAAMVEPALDGLQTALDSKELPAILKAAQLVLDRAGFHPRSAVEVTGEDGGPLEVAATVATLPPTLLCDACLSAARRHLRGEDVEPYQPPPPPPKPKRDVVTI
jgi:hypothetical protein